MHSINQTIGKLSLPVITCNTLIVGSGAAGYSAAIRLLELGQHDVRMVTEQISGGTSRNTGSDKQTYYKLGLCGDIPDCPHDMALDFFAGEGVDGDHALIEAALSARCFYTLCELGVPFPCNRYGEFVGYKTDHDPRARATSCGPLTSRLMTEALEKKAAALGLTIDDHTMAVSILKRENGQEIAGLLAVDLSSREENPLVLYRCTNIVYATGGPAGIYRQSVYPTGHWGASGVALEAGVRGKNLTEWQYGLASINPRWNVSGTYMQVLPRFVSVDSNGEDHDFLNEFFTDKKQMLSLIFRKGYQWPFDCRKAVNDSSVIDLLVYRECALRGRRVYLDYTQNPCEGGNLDSNLLDEEAYDYLYQADALSGRPIDRLLHMNEPAYALYRSKGIDLKTQRLEIALCAQHNNGGLDVDAWWQTNLAGLFVIGEAAGTHGVHRPGGSALNAGQVGALRAAQYIAARRTQEPPCWKEYNVCALQEVERHRLILEHCVGGDDTVAALLCSLRTRMSEVAGAIRREDGIAMLLKDVSELLEHFEGEAHISNRQELQSLYRLRDVLLSQKAYLYAMLDYIRHGGPSRGSALYYAADGALCEGLEECFRLRTAGSDLRGQVQLTASDDSGVRCIWRPVRPLPEGSGFFETVWREYREHQNIV